MRVVVTGGAGYVGAVVTGHLLALGMEVAVFDNLVYGAESLLAFFGHPSFQFFKGDIRERKRLVEVMAGADAVVHLAAIVGEPACAVNEDAAWSVNCGGTEATLAAAHECGVNRVVFASTCSNYGVSRPGEVADESMPLRPVSLYARSKVEAEQLVLANGMRLCPLVLRLGTICGLSPRMRFDLLVSEMARSAVLGDTVRIFAPDAWRPFLHIRDAARVIAHCLQMPERLVRCKVFNVVGANHQKRDLARLVVKHYPATRIEMTDGAADLRDYRANGERIRRELAFDTRFTVEDAFTETAVAVATGVFRDVRWPGHSALPLEVPETRGN